MLISLHSFGSYTALTDSSNIHALFSDILPRDNEDLLLRLYKRYVKRHEVQKTISYLEAQCSYCKGEKSKLLSNIISACKFGFRKSELCLEKFGEYEPLKFVILEEPYCTISDYIPLEDYDNNEGEPFWMRPDYLIEKYGKKAGL